MKKKILSVVMAATLAVAALTACGSGSSAGVSAVILLQAESSLEAIYGSEADVIRANCACYCYFPGGMDDRSIEIASKKFDIPYQDILSAGMGKLFVVRSGHKPVYISRFDTLKQRCRISTIPRNKAQE